MDNFSFDESHLGQWQMPEGLDTHLPADLLANASDWQKAGAALCTALDRTHEFYKEAINYAYPDKSQNPLSRRVSEQAVSGAPSTTPAVCMPTPIITATIGQLEKLALTHSRDQQRTQNIGMETPPFSPVDSGVCATPVIYDGKMPTKHTLPDLARINTQLSPRSSPPAADFDANSWERYTRMFGHEISDIKQCLNRLNGYGKKVEILLKEMSSEMKPQVKLAFLDFTKWWDGMRPKVRSIENRGASVEEPVLAYVTFEREMVRASEMGLTHDGVLESPSGMDTGRLW